MNAETQIDTKEGVVLGASDPQFFYSTWFPKTCRMGFAPFHRDMDDLLESPHSRYINLQAFRGAAKTSKLRMYIAKRVSYRLSRTILYVGASEAHAVRTVRWLKAQIERNKVWASTFGLRKGGTWQDTQIEILVDTLSEDGKDVTTESVWLLAVGITGKIRGINFDDYRPDLIVLDDVLDDENAATEDQRDKYNTLIMGAVKQSLTPRTENPEAKMIMLQTPLDLNDASTLALKNPEWVSGIFPCWTLATIGLPLEMRKSSWEERYPTEDLIKEAQAAIVSNDYSIFAKEKECRLITSERAKFKGANLRYWDDPGEPPLRHGTIVISIDPVPPPSEKQIAKNLHDKDNEAISVTMRQGGNYYLLAYELNRGHEPIWTAQTTLKFIRMFQPLRVVVEAVNYQRVLKGLLENYLKRHQIYIEVKPLNDRRSKYNRIIGAIMDVAAVGKLYVSRKHLDFIRDYLTYPSVERDDLLDSVATGLAELSNPLFEGDDGGFFSSEEQDDFTRPLNVRRGVP